MVYLDNIKDWIAIIVGLIVIGSIINIILTEIGIMGLFNSLILLLGGILIAGIFTGYIAKWDVMNSGIQGSLMGVIFGIIVLIYTMTPSGFILESGIFNLTLLIIYFAILGAIGGFIGGIIAKKIEFKPLIQNILNKYGKKNVLGIFISLFLILVFFASIFYIYTTIPEKTYSEYNASSIPTTTYSGREITFKYPQSWKEVNITSSRNAIVGFGDPKSIDISKDLFRTDALILKLAMPPGSTLKSSYQTRFNNLAGQGSKYQSISDKTVRVNGLIAYEKIYQLNVNGVQMTNREIWLEKNGNIYIISCEVLSSDFDRQQANFDVIIDSFHFQ